MKIDCSITENYLKEKRRMTDCCSIDCRECGLANLCNWEDIKGNEKDAVDVVQAWSDAHPQKTYLEDLKEKYPNVKLGNLGAPKFCPNLIGLKNISGGNCINSCDDCWNQIMEEQNA